MSWDFAAPAYWNANDKCIKTGESELTADQCVIQGEHFFIKGSLEIPVAELSSVFALTVWTSLSRETFERTRVLWNDAKRVNEPPYFGWLSSSVPSYPETINLKTHVHTRQVGVKPFIELEPTDHPLSLEQKSGITLARVRELAEILMHPGGK